jgi:DNA processing protein
MLHEIALTMIPNIGPSTAKSLIAYCGSAEAVFKAPKAKLVKVPQVGEERAKNIINAKEFLINAEEELKFIDKHKIQALFYTNPKFPTRLMDCNDSPIILYYKGNTDLNKAKVLSIVGTRNITEAGRDLTKKLVEDLAGEDILITSGLAYGVDIMAHNTALDMGIPTVGVLGHGLNRIYPEQHRNSAKRMLENGGLLTEYNSQSVFINKNFPERNRIVAGMCDALVVVESGIKGGALITANIANSYNREVFAYPGRVEDKYSQGCNFLIKTFKAQLIESGHELLDLLMWKSETTNANRKPKKQLTLVLSPSEQKIYSLLKENGELEIDKLVAISGMPSGKLAELLLEMELNDVIVPLPGKRYKVI